MKVEEFFKENKGITIDMALDADAKYTAIDMAMFATQYAYAIQEHLLQNDKVHTFIVDVTNVVLSDNVYDDIPLYKGVVLVYHNDEWKDENPQTVAYDEGDFSDFIYGAIDVIQSTLRIKKEDDIADKLFDILFESLIDIQDVRAIVVARDDQFAVRTLDSLPSKCD